MHAEAQPLLRTAAKLREALSNPPKSLLTLCMPFTFPRLSRLFRYWTQCRIQLESCGASSAEPDADSADHILLPSTQSLMMLVWPLWNLSKSELLLIYYNHLCYTGLCVRHVSISMPKSREHEAWVTLVKRHCSCCHQRFDVALEQVLTGS